MLKLYKINLHIITYTLLVIAFAFFACASTVLADSTPSNPPSTDTGAICEGIGLAGGDCSSTGGSGNKVTTIIANIIDVFSWAVGAISVIMIIFAGFKYVTSGGDQNKIKTAKDTIIYALVGLVIVVLSQILVNFVLKASIDATSSQSGNGQNQGNNGGSNP